MIQIRLLEKKDWQGLFDIVDSVDKTLVGMNSDTVELVDDWLNTIEIGIWEVYVAVLPQEEILREENRLIRKILPWKQLKHNSSGIIGLVTLYGDSQEEDIQEGEFDIGITIADAYQRRGIGRELLEFIIERGTTLEYEKATLWTRQDNQPMKILATKLGFVEGNMRSRLGYLWNQYVKIIKENRKEE